MEGRVLSNTFDNLG